MSKVCERCEKGPSTGHNVSHSVRRTNRRFMPNLITKKVLDVRSGITKKQKICMKCLRTSSKVS